MYGRAVYTFKPHRAQPASKTTQNWHAIGVRSYLTPQQRCTNARIPPKKNRNKKPRAHNFKCTISARSSSCGHANAPHLTYTFPEIAQADTERERSPSAEIGAPRSVCSTRHAADPLNIARTNGRDDLAWPGGGCDRRVAHARL